jgi:membrane-associated phospholipid phosphatase
MTNLRLPLAAIQLALLGATFCFAPSQSASADSWDQFGLHKAHKEASFASGAGNLIFLASGTLLPLVQGGSVGRQQTVRTMDALLTSTLITEGLKSLVHEQRPDHSDYNSFPSGHATAAFTVATMQAHYHPRQALLWYGGATLIGASRVQLDRHYWHDVVAGAAIGYFTAKLELRQGKGLILRPFIHSNGPSANGDDKVSGISLSKTF